MSYTEEKARQILLQQHFLEEVGSKSKDYAGVFSCPKHGHSDNKDAIMKHYIQRLSKNNAQRLYNRRRECSDAEIIGILYLLGIGVPKNEQCSEFWLHRRYLTKSVDCQMFVTHSSMLKQHLIKVCDKRSGYLYDHSTRRIERCSMLEETEPSHNMVPACLVYKAIGSVYTLHNVVVAGDTFVYALPNIKEVPQTLTLPSSTRYMLVTGALIPNEKFVRPKGGEDAPLLKVLYHHIRTFETKAPGNETKFSRTLSFGRKLVYFLNNDWKLSEAGSKTALEIKTSFRVLKQK